MSSSDSYYHQMAAAQMGPCQAADQLWEQGSVEESMAAYREILQSDPGNAVALNNLAWALATARNRGLRNGREAAQLAARAVELSNHSLPRFMDTLAAAEAEAGDFARAVQAASEACELAQLTGRGDIAAHNTRLLPLYAAGKTADALVGP